MYGSMMAFDGAWIMGGNMEDKQKDKKGLEYHMDG